MPSAYSSPRSSPPAVLGRDITRRSFHAIVDGVKLHWTEHGAGRPLVILHGLADSQLSWASVAAALGARYRVLCLDLPGCGLSGRPDASYGIDWQARLVLAWLDGLGIEDFDVVGHSYGGGVALWLLLHRARAIRKMALIAPGGLGLEVTFWLRAAAVFGLFDATGQRMIGPITRLLLLRHGGTLAAMDRRKLYACNSSAGTARAFGRMVRDVINWRGQTRHVLQHLHRLRELPSVALFWGERDRVIPVSHGEALCALFENCSFWRLPSGGHFLHWQAPNALASALRSYLDSTEVRPSRLKRQPAERRVPTRLAEVISSIGSQSSATDEHRASCASEAPGSALHARGEQSRGPQATMRTG